MSTFDYRSRVTVVDVLDAGACIEGVVAWVVLHRGVIAGSTSDWPDERWIVKAANGGSGYGYGDGDGDGYGDGDV